MIRPTYPAGELARWPSRWWRSSAAGLDAIRRGPRSWSDPTAPPSPRARLVLLGDVMTVWNGDLPRVDSAVRDVVRRADVVLANCEGPVASAGGGRQGRFRVIRHRMDVDFVTGLVEALGSEPRRWVMSIANNHIGDNGLAGIEGTERALERAGFQVAGRRGRDRAPVTVRELEVGRMGITCWTRWLNHREFPPDDGVWRQHDIAGIDWGALRSSLRLDLLLAFPHWDREFCLAPSSETREAARHLVNAGVDLIVGHHPHVAQPLEWIGDRPVVYSIGSFHGPLPLICRRLHRLGWIAELELGRGDRGRVRPVRLELHPVVLVQQQRGHAVVPLDAAPEADRRRMVPVVDLLFPVSGSAP